MYRYDSGSLMHYRDLSNAIHNRPGNMAAIGQRSGLSNRDRKAIRQMYRVLRVDDSGTLLGVVLGGHPKPAIDRHLKTGHHT